MRRKARPSWALFAAFERFDTDHFGRLTVQATHENDEENILAYFFIVIISR